MSTLDSATSINREWGEALVHWGEVEEAVYTLQGSKSPRVNNIPAELIKYERPEILKALMTIYQKIWETKQWKKSGPNH